MFTVTLWYPGIFILPRIGSTFGQKFYIYSICIYFFTFLKQMFVLNNRLKDIILIQINKIVEL